MKNIGTNNIIAARKGKNNFNFKVILYNLNNRQYNKFVRLKAFINLRIIIIINIRRLNIINSILKKFKLIIITYLMFFSVYSYVSPQVISVSDSSGVTPDSTTNTEQTISADENFVAPKIMVIGHSWAYGAFHNDSSYFSRYGLQIDEITKVGTSLQWTLDNLKSVQENKYDAICIFSGINDYQSDVNYMAEKFLQIFEEGFRKAPVLFVFNIPDWSRASEKVKVLNEWLTEMGKINEGLIILDINKEVELQKKDGFKMSADGLHPSDYGIVKDFFIYFVQKYYNIK